jgi:DNA-binding protein HU-beta
MNKGDLIEYVAGQAGLTKADAGRALDAALDGVVKGVKKDGSLTLVGFGTFKKTKRKARMGVNPATGAKIKIPASVRLTFKASKGLKV